MNQTKRRDVGSKFPASGGSLSAVLSVLLLAGGLAAGCASQSSLEESAAEGEERETEQSAEPDYESTDKAENNNQKAKGDETEQPAGQETAQAESDAESGGDVSDEEIGQFARATVTVSKVQQQARRKLQQAESREEAEKVKSQVKKKVKQAVEAEGMEMERFKAISKQIREDKQLRNRLKSKIQEIRGKRQGGMEK